MKVREPVKVIEKGGWEQTRMKASQRRYRNPDKGGAVAVAGKPVADMNHPGFYGYSGEDGATPRRRCVATRRKPTPGYSSWMP
jgi:predicted RNA binding protein YcfA (HicA-like mRNA interferase family)